MIYPKDLKELDFEHINEYFDYIVESITNGQKSQARFFIKDLSKGQKKDALDYIENGFFDCDEADEAKQIIINSL